MDRKQILIERLQRLFKECDMHIYRIKQVKKKMEPFMPLNQERYKNLTDDEVEHIDQFLFRFGKLQDAMGQKLFRLVLMFLEEDVDGKPFLDILNLMEKLSLIDSADEWRQLREYRNELAHNYEDDPIIASKTINTIYEKIYFLISTYNNMKEYCLSRVKNEVKV